MQQEQTWRPHKFHIWYGTAILILSALFYFITISFIVNYNNTHGGGQATLPGMDIVVLLAISVAACVLLIIQAIMLRSIVKRQTVSLLNFLIAIPIIVFLPMCLKMMELPGKYYYTVFSCLLVSNIATCIAIKYRNKLLVAGSFTFGIISIGIAAWLFNATNSDSRWWNNGPEIVYNEDGIKIKEAEMKKKGIIWGNYTEWDYEGRLTWFRRYPNGALQTPDSAVDYMHGEVWQMRHSFDSAGNHYERQNTYDMSNDTVGVRVLMVQQLVDKTHNLYQYNTWYTDTQTLREAAGTFDSNGTRYSRHVYYKKDGSITSSETLPTSSDYIIGSTDALY